MRIATKAIYKQIETWLLCIIAIIISLCVSGLDDNCVSAWLKVVNNVCYGYIAGFAFYLPSVFFPELRKEGNTIKRIKDERFCLINLIQQIERKLFREKEVPKDPHIYGITMCYSLMEGPHYRDTEAMKRDVVIKPEFRNLFSLLSCKMQELKSDINHLSFYNEEYNTLAKNIIKFVVKYEEVIKPGIMHGEFDNNIPDFANALIEVKKILIQ